MKFLLSLALIVVLASAHKGKGGRGMDLFKPLPDCAAEKTEEQVAMMEEKLARLSETVKMVCEAQTEEDEEADVGTQSVRGKGKGKGGKRGPKGSKEVMELLTAERCAAAAEDLDAVVAEVHAALDPCQQQLSVENLVEKVQSMCTESDSVSEEDEEAVVETLSKRKGDKGKDREGEEKSNPLCELEDVAALYKSFFNENGEAVNAFEFEQGMNKLKLMTGLDAAHKENCVEEEKDEVVEEEKDEVVEEEKDEVVEEEKDEVVDEEPATEGLLRRLLKGKRGGKRGEKSSEEKEEKELPASMQLVADFKNSCTVVDTDSVNALVDAVQEAMAVEKAEREAEMEQKKAEMEAKREAHNAEMKQRQAEREARKAEKEAERAEKETAEEGSDSDSEKPTEKRQGGRGRGRGQSGRGRGRGSQRKGRWGRRL